MRTEGRRAVTDPGRACWAGLVAVLLALIAPTANATAATATTYPAAGAAYGPAAHGPAATAPVAHASDDAADSTAGPTGIAADRDVPDGKPTRVVKKVRGVLAPDGVILPLFAPAEPEPAPLTVSSDCPVRVSATFSHDSPRRGPPIAGHSPVP